MLASGRGDPFSVYLDPHVDEAFGRGEGGRLGVRRGSLDETATELIVRHILATLESRVGERLVDLMTSEEVDHFAKVLSTDEAAARAT